MAGSSVDQPKKSFEWYVAECKRLNDVLQSKDAEIEKLRKLCSNQQQMLQAMGVGGDSATGGVFADSAADGLNEQLVLDTYRLKRDLALLHQHAEDISIENTPNTIDTSGYDEVDCSNGHTEP